MIKKRGFRIEEIESKLNDVIESIAVVEENLPEGLGEFLNLGLIKEGIYKKVEFAIESVIDIFNIINSDLRLGVPEMEEDIINNLRKNNILDNKILSLIAEMKKFRNILVHKYGKIDDKKAFEDIKDGLKDFEQIIKEIENFLEKHKKDKGGKKLLS